MLQDFKKYFGLLKKYARGRISWIVAGAGIGLIAQICLLVSPFLTRFIIDAVILKGNIHLFRYVLLISILVLVILFSSSISANYILYKTFARASIELKRKLFRILQFAPFDFFSKNPSGEIAYRLLSDTDVVINSWVHLLVTIPLQLILFIAGIFMVLWQKDLALFVFGVLTVHLFIIMKFRSPLHKYALIVKQKNQEVSGYTVEQFSKIQLIRSLCTERREENNFFNKLSDLVMVALRSYMIGQCSGSVTLVVNNFWALGILWYGGIQVANGKMTLGTLMAFLLLSNILYAPLNTLVNFFLSFQDIRASLNRILEYMEIKPYIIEPPKAMEFVPTEGRVSIKNCSFAYNGRLILKNVNLEIPPKSIFGLVGPSGAGKTTLCRLIARFYDPQEGKIFFDGKDIKEIALHSLRKSILLTLQNDYVLTGTIWENITYGVDNVDKKQVLIAIKKAGIDFIEKLPYGYHTPVGVGGFNLSAGEAQRIALARALLYSPKIFILDEPTSFIDAETEEKIKKCLLELKENFTIILIAHRLSTVMTADMIAVLDNGEIIETGKPLELIVKEGSVFKRMYHSVLAK